MKEINCKLPIEEDYQAFVINNKKEPSPKHLKIVIVSALLFLAILSTTIGFTIKSFSEISALRREIDQMKSSFQALQQKFSDNFDVSEYGDERIFRADNLDDSNYDDYYDLALYERDYEDDDNLSNEQLETGGKFTKDAKEATPLPRLKRNIVGFTEDGVALNADSYQEIRKKNSTHRKHHRHHFTSTTPPRRFASLGSEENYQITPPPRVPYPSRPHLLEQEDVSNTFAKPSYLRSGNLHQSGVEEISNPFTKPSYLRSGNSQYSGENPEVEFSVVAEDQSGVSRTRHRPRRLEIDERPARMGRMRPLPTAHFHGDTSRYVLGQHDNFDGNGRLRHPQRTFVDWAESTWFRTLGMDQHFSLNDGVLTIKDSGLYFIYAQIYYLDVHDTNGFRVYKNETATILQCTTMTHSVDKVTKGNTCYTAAAEYLHENDRISVGDLSSSRYSLFEPGKSFFGVIKLGDVKIK